MESTQIAKLELLSPARDLEFGKAAINHGADAVYIGAPKFGARTSASNSLNVIDQLVHYAHLFNAKVYATLNTILYDNELEEASGIAHALYNSGIDGLIIQDLGMLEMNLPPVPLIASTQTHNNCLEKVLFFESLGFKRVILARELSINEIDEIKKHSKIELESFVHGALCVSYSGQCYMSEAVCNRSGNRGDCAQPCRSKYDLLDSKGNYLIRNKHLLSLQDLNLSGYLKRMIGAGVTSFKIEGRLKDISYVKNITSFYRQRLDEILENQEGLKKASSGKIYHHFTPSPEKSFNRGFTTYNINGRKELVGSPDTQKSTGKRMGYVTSVHSNWITIDSDQLVSGDGLCFFDKNRVLQGTSVQRMEGVKVYLKETGSLSVGTEIFRNHDQNFEKLLASECANRKVGVHFILKEEDCHSYKLVVTDEDGYKEEISIETNNEVAKNTDGFRNSFIKQVSQLGGTIFEVLSVNFETENLYFIPISVINNARRSIIAKLQEMRLAMYKSDQREIITKSEYSTSAGLSYMSNVANKLARSFYTKHGSKNIEPAFELLKDRSNKQVMTTKYCIKFQFEACPKYYKNKNNWEDPIYLKDNHHKYRLEFDCGNCVMKVFFEK